MNIKKKWCYMSLLAFAWLVSLFSSLFGCVFIFGALFASSHPGKEIIPYLLLVLAVPLFALASGGSKLFIRLIWTTAFIYPFTVLLFESDAFDTKSFMMLVAAAGTLSFVLLAALLQFSTRFKSLPIETDSQGAEHEPAA
jgi:hypothetical protein